jgi:xanthine dehydrogenase accessory factor
VAWAIVAEILAVKNRRAGGFLRDRRGPIHDRPLEEQVPSAAG